MSTTPVTIRPLQQTDSAFLCSILQNNEEYYQIFFDPEDDPTEWARRVKRFLTQNEVQHFIIEAKGEPMGWISYADAEDKSRELCILVIHPAHLRSGYGAQALLWLIEKSRKDKLQALLLNVNQSNARAIQFYQQFGFAIYAEEIVPECNDATDLAQYKMRLPLAF